MRDNFLNYLDQERKAIKDLMAESPALASILGRDTGDDIADPHIRLLIEGVATLNARTRQKLDDMFPELTETLLGALHPGLVRPLPPMLLAQVTLPGDTTTSKTLPGGTEFTSQPYGGRTCSFRSASDPVTLNPVNIQKAELVLASAPHAALRDGKKGEGILRLLIAPLTPGVNLQLLDTSSLVFHIVNDERPARRLHELIVGQSLGAVIFGSGGQTYEYLGAEQIDTIGFSAGEILTPLSDAVPSHYTMLSEFFAFPQKHLGFCLRGMSPASWGQSGIVIDIHLAQLPPDLQNSFEPGHIRLNCVPLINLFTVDAKPYHFSAAYPEQRIQLTRHVHDAIEPWSVAEVKMNRSGSGATRPLVFEPLLRLTAQRDVGGNAAVAGQFAERRVPRLSNPGLHGTIGESRRAYRDDVVMSIIADPANPATVMSLDKNTVTAKVLCLDTDLHNFPNVGSGKQLNIKETGLGHATCLTKPSPVYRLKGDAEYAWRLTSQLVLNHLSISGGRNGAHVLRELIRVHHRGLEDPGAAVISSIAEVEAAHATTRTRGSRRGREAFCSGLDIVVTLEDQPLSGGGAFQLMCALDQFFSQYAPINSFTRLAVKFTSSRSRYKVWPARTGTQTLI